MSYVLVAEDDPYIRLLIQRKLESAGYKIRASANGDEALALALSDVPQILLLDIMLPDRSGLEICREVKRQLGAASPPILIISARGQSDDVKAGLAAGADDYLIKPFAPSDLLTRVQKWTAQR